MPSLAEMTRFSLYALIAVQTAFAVIWPHDFSYLRPLLFVVQVSAAGIAAGVVVFVPAMRGLIHAPVRVLHGFEHATINVLAERGIEVDNGVARDRSFEIVLDQHDARGLTVAEVKLATESVITRISRGEHALVYSPRCGTSWLVARMVIAIGVAAVGAVTLAYDVAPGYTFAGTVVAFASAMRASRPLGLLAQRMFTVSPHFAAARVRDVERTESGNWIHFEIRVDVQTAPSAVAEIIG
jgi:Domain of unknown function (DUF6391)